MTLLNSPRATGFHLQIRCLGILLRQLRTHFLMRLEIIFHALSSTVKRSVTFWTGFEYGFWL
jgi:hypothetical protein